MIEPTYAGLALVALVALVLAAVIALGRARRWGAACTRCDWRTRALTLETSRRRAHQHTEAAGHSVNLYRRN